MSEKYVYIYLDPASLVVRYVGSGYVERMFDHTKPHQLVLAKNNSPFNRWLKERTHVQWRYYRFRIIGPVSEKIAHIWENALILEYFETTLNVRAANNGKELRPALHHQGPTGPRSESGFAKQTIRQRRENFSCVGTNLKPGRGIRREGSGWRVTVQDGGKITRKRFLTYCEALQFRKAEEAKILI